MRRYKFREAVLTDIGLRRNENQDAYGIAHSAGTSLFVVADGMGGARGGATASAMAIHVIINDAIKENGLITRPSLKQAIEKANAAIYARSRDDEDLAGMGTTVVALAFVNECAIVAHVGDSRIYRLRDGELVQLTHDHTLVQELVDSGAIPKEEAENHPIAHMLTRSLGPSPHVEVEIQALPDPTQVEDRFLLCSDGLYNLVTDQEIAEHLQTETPEEAIRKLISLALERGGTDNVTIEVLEVCPLEDETCNFDYPPTGEMRFVFSEGVAAPELRSILEQQDIVDDEDTDEELSEDTARALPSVAGLGLESGDDSSGLEDIGEEALLENAGASIESRADADPAFRIRLQASLFFVVGLTAGIFGFFLYQYSGVRGLSSTIRDTSHTAKVAPDGQLAQDLTGLNTKSAVSATVTELSNSLPTSIPSMSGEGPGVQDQRAIVLEFAAALALPDAPYIQVRDPEVATIEANRPIVWENEARKIERIQSEQQASATQTQTTEVAPVATEERLLTSDERSQVLLEKRSLRDRISDVDSKLRVLGFTSRAKAEELANEVEKQARQKNDEIVEIRRSVDLIRNEAAMWNSRLDLARGRSAVRLADEVSIEYEILKPVFEAFSSASERYAAAVEQWQAEPNNVEFATEMGTSGRGLQQARIALEQKLAEFVTDRMRVIGNEIASSRLREDLLTVQRDQLSRFEGYLRGYTDLTAVRKKELRDTYYKERGDAAERLASFKRQISDSREIEMLLESYRADLSQLTESQS